MSLSEGIKKCLKEINEKKENINLTQLEVIERNQEFFDAFNTFMISSDIKVFGKLLARALLYDKVKNIPGDIIECGVFKGDRIIYF